MIFLTDYDLRLPTSKLLKQLQDRQNEVIKVGKVAVENWNHLFVWITFHCICSKAMLKR